MTCTPMPPSLAHSVSFLELVRLPLECTLGTTMYSLVRKE